MPHASRRSFLAAAGGFAMTSLVSSASAQTKIKPGPDAALLVVDVQNCFTPGGSLAVDKGDEIIPLINRIAKAFQNVVLTQDWHTAKHISFASSHAGKKPFDVVDLPYGKQVLWPDHCVQGTDGAAIHRGIDIPHAQLVIRKGFNPLVDSYSAFIEADGKSKTGLDGYLAGARHQDGLRRGSRHRLLRRMDRAGRAQARPRCHRHRGRLPRHRHPRLARGRLEEHGHRGRQARAVERTGDPSLICHPGTCARIWRLRLGSSGSADAATHRFRKLMDACWVRPL